MTGASDGRANDGAGREGVGREGAGNEGAGNKDAGREGAGNEGIGNEGVWNEYAGNEAVGSEGAGNDAADEDALGGSPQASGAGPLVPATAVGSPAPSSAAELPVTSSAAEPLVTSGIAGPPVASSAAGPPITSSATGPLVLSSAAGPPAPPRTEPLISSRAAESPVTSNSAVSPITSNAAGSPAAPRTGPLAPSSAAGSPVTTGFVGSLVTSGIAGPPAVARTTDGAGIVRAAENAVGTRPTDHVVSPQPTDGTAGAQPTDGTAGVQPAEGTAGLRPIDGTAVSRRTDGTAGVQPTDGTAGTQPAHGTAGPRPTDGTVGARPAHGTAALRAADGTAVARAVDELRRGQPVRVTSAGGDLDVLAVELADDAGVAALERGGRSGLIVTPRRAAILHLANQRAGAGTAAVWIERPAWLDLAATVATADPLGDLATPFKGPFRTVDAGRLADAAAAGVRLAKLGGLLPAVLGIAVAGRGDPSTGAGADQGDRGGSGCASAGDILTVDAAAVAAYARADRLRIVTRARLPLDGAPDTEVVAFRPAEGGPEHLALLIGPAATAPPVLVRLHSACLTGDVLGSLKCDCGPQLRAGLAAIAAAGGGVLLYLQQEGRGIGLINKLRAYALQDQGFDTVDANLRLGFEPDERDFAVAATMLRLLGVGEIRLLTNNPDKVAAMTAHGIAVVERIGHAMPANPHNAHYLDTKRDRSGHYL